MSAEHEYVKVISNLTALLESLPSNPPILKELSSFRLRKLREDIRIAIDKLRSLAASLDPIKQPTRIYDPSDPQQVGEMVAGALVFQAFQPLETVPRFYGSGVYALYYKGTFDAYLPISSKNHPIYVGKADPQRPHAKTPSDQGARLCSRLAEHSKSIRLAASLNIDDFECRYLVVASGWQKSAEDHLIARYKPIWNNEMKICFGFGKHGDDPKTRGNKRSPWDTLHPGRPWAAGSQPGRTTQEIKADIAEHFRKHPPETI